LGDGSRGPKNDALDGPKSSTHSKGEFLEEGANGWHSVMYRENLALAVQKARELIQLPLMIVWAQGITY